MDQPVEQFKVGLCRSVFMGLSRVFPPFGCLFYPRLGDGGAEMGGLNFSG